MPLFFSRGWAAINLYFDIPYLLMLVKITPLIFHFLQIYNEQITDLLDPSQRNLQVKGIYDYFIFSSSLIFFAAINPTSYVYCFIFSQIREDVKSGVYVENLKEESACTMKDVTQLLIKVCSLLNFFDYRFILYICFVMVSANQLYRKRSVGAAYLGTCS